MLALGARVKPRSTIAPLGYAPGRKLVNAPARETKSLLSWNLTVAITAPGQTYTVNIAAGTLPEIKIDWGDGVVETFISTGQKTHTYWMAKTFTVQVSGRFAVGGNIRCGSNSANQARLTRTSAVPTIQGLANFDTTFQNCTGLKFIASDLVALNPNITVNAFRYLFDHCVNLTEIPENLFRYNTKVSSSAFNGAFRNCSKLKAIPTDLFRYNPLVSTYGFALTFSACSLLTSIPTDLFKYNTNVSTNGFWYTFYSCYNITSIPADLFRYNTSVSSDGFSLTFYGITFLTSIPDNLFRYNTAISTNGFSKTFSGCTALTSVPADLFRYNTACTSFKETFSNCTKLQQNATIFYADGEQATRFINKSMDFTNCFNVTSFSGTTGVAPDLWNCNFGTGTPTKTDCWQGHGVSTVSNFGDIPADWT